MLDHYDEEHNPYNNDHITEAYASTVADCALFALGDDMMYLQEQIEQSSETDFVLWMFEALDQLIEEGNKLYNIANIQRRL